MYRNRFCCTCFCRFTYSSVYTYSIYTQHIQIQIMIYCSAYNCHLNSSMPNVHFHNIRESWKHLKWKSKSPSKICSLHFTSDFYKPKGKLLKLTATPTLMFLNSVAPTTPQACLQDHSYSLPSGLELKRRLDISVSTGSKYQHHSYYMASKVKKLKEKIVSFEETVSEIKEKFCIPDTTYSIISAAGSSVPKEIFDRGVKSLQNIKKR